MPIYEYKCDRCGERFELRRSMSDSDQKTRCPKCGADGFAPRFLGLCHTFWRLLQPQQLHLKRQFVR